MRKLALLLFLVVVVTSCSPPEKTIDVSFFGTRSDKYHIIYDLSEEGFYFLGRKRPLIWRNQVRRLTRGQQYKVETFM